MANVAPCVTPLARPSEIWVRDVSGPPAREAAVRYGLHNIYRDVTRGRSLRFIQPWRFPRPPARERQEACGWFQPVQALAVLSPIGLIELDVSERSSAFEKGLTVPARIGRAVASTHAMRFGRSIRCAVDMGPSRMGSLAARDCRATCVGTSGRIPRPACFGALDTPRVHVVAALGRATGTGRSSLPTTMFGRRAPRSRP
jgi:hypothetical protein